MIETILLIIWAVLATIGLVVFVVAWRGAVGLWKNSQAEFESMQKMYKDTIRKYREIHGVLADRHFDWKDKVPSSKRKASKKAKKHSRKKKVSRK